MTFNYLLKPLLLTIIIESIVSYVLGMRNKKDYLLLILINIITNISINLLNYLSIYYLINNILRIFLIYIVCEIIVVLVEYRFYKYYLIEDMDCFRLSLFTNLFSLLGGIIIWLTKII